MRRKRLVAATAVFLVLTLIALLILSARGLAAQTISPTLAPIAEAASPEGWVQVAAVAAMVVVGAAGLWIYRQIRKGL